MTEDWNELAVMRRLIAAFHKTGSTMSNEPAALSELRALHLTLRRHIEEQRVRGSQDLAMRQAALERQQRALDQQAEAMALARRNSRLWRLAMSVIVVSTMALMATLGLSRV